MVNKAFWTWLTNEKKSLSLLSFAVLLSACSSADDVEIFYSLDTDQDGVLSQDEIQAGQAQYQINPYDTLFNPLTCQLEASSADTDGDGFINLSEFQAAFSSCFS